jgi:DNA-binding response OmpR family regulator
MLHLFVANSGRVLSKQELFEAIWPNVHVADDSLFQCIREIRTALGGYLFEADVLVDRSAVTKFRGSGRRSDEASEPEVRIGRNLNRRNH